jgi:hypothetical protein
MISAVSTVLDRNPGGAIAVLLPVYGPDFVCGQQQEWEPVTSATAERRLLLLSQIESSTDNKQALEACRIVLKNKLKLSGNVEK